jgi:prefoldin subunit 5
LKPARNFLEPKAENLQKNLLKLNVAINRLQSEHTALRNKMEKNNTLERRARTRTLIQMGSLLNLVGLAQLCDIAEGVR